MNELLTIEQGNQALALRRAGYSIRDIAAELGVRKWAIEKLLIQERTVTPKIQSQPLSANPVQLPQQPALAEQTLTAELVEHEKQIANAQKQLEAQQALVIAQIKAANDYKRQTEAQAAALLAKAILPPPELVAKEHKLAAMQKQVDVDRAAINAKIGQLIEQQNKMESQKQGLSTEALTLGRLKNELVQKELALEKRYEDLAKIKNALPDEERQFAEFRKRDRKEKLVERYNFLVQELMNNSSDCQWSGDDVDEYLERAESVKDSVVAFCQENGIDPTRLLIYQGLVFLINDIEEEQTDQTSGLFSGTSVTFNYSPQYQAKIQSLTIETFDDPAPEGINEPDGSEEEETD